MQLSRTPLILLAFMFLLSAGSALLPHDYLLLSLLLVPLVGLIIGAVLPHHMSGKTWGLAVSGSTLLTSISIALQYHWYQGGYQFAIHGLTIPGLNMQFAIGVDQISLPLVLLTTFLHPLAVTASLRSIHVRSRQHYMLLNFLLVAMLGAFVATDLLLFYGFFEISLVPLFFIIGIWGGKDRRRAAVKLFLFTFAGSVFMLLSIIYLGSRAGTFYMPDVIHFAQTQLTLQERYWVLLGLIAAFVVKTPLFPFHTWLPLAHAEAPTAGSVDLAGLVLKLGTYGMLRIALPIGLITLAGSVTFPGILHLVAILALISVIYAALVAWVQTDFKKIIAYSAVSHLGVCVLGMLSLNAIGMAGSVLYMINHGISSAALFLIVGMIYLRYHTRDIREISGLARAMPILSFFLVFFAMASIGLPGLNSFVSEFLCLLGTFQSEHLGPVYGTLASTGMILSAIYMLYLVGRVLFGPLYYPVLTSEHETHETVDPAYIMGGDINPREIAVLAPLMLITLFLGLFPTPLLRSLEQPLAELRHATPAIVSNSASAQQSTTIAQINRHP